MKLTLIGHDDLYAVEQLQMSLFGTQVNNEDYAVSKLCRGGRYLTAVTTISIGGRKTSAQKRLAASSETVKLRRQLL